MFDELIALLNHIGHACSLDSGTSEGVRKGWITRKAHGYCREHQDIGFKDNFGTTNISALAADPKLNTERGKAVFSHLAWKKSGFEPKAMYRKGLGWVGVDAGVPGNPKNDFAGGHGITHILAKHPGAEKIIADVIQNGTAYHHPDEVAERPNFRKVNIVHGNYLVTLSKFRDGRIMITGFDPGETVVDGKTVINNQKRQEYLKRITSQKVFGG